MTPPDAAESNRTSAPTFIVGSSRSGTTMLIRLLTSFAGVGECRDGGMVLRFGDHLAHYGDISEAKNMRRLIGDLLASYEYRCHFYGSPVDVDTVFDSLAEQTYPALIDEIFRRKAATVGAQHWIDKTTFYAFRIPDLLTIFPNARIVHLYRDGRDVALSLYQKNWGPKNAYAAARFWRSHVEGARQGGEQIDREQYREVSYEKLLDQPVEQFGRLADYLGLGDQLGPTWEDDVRKYIKPGNYRKWKREMDPKEVRVFERVAGDVLEACDYEVISPSEQRTPLTWWERGYFSSQNMYRRLRAGETFGAGLAKRWQLIRRRLLTFTRAG